MQFIELKVFGTYKFAYSQPTGVPLLCLNSHNFTLLCTMIAHRGIDIGMFTV